METCMQEACQRESLVSTVGDWGGKVGHPEKPRRSHNRDLTHPTGGSGATGPSELSCLEASRLGLTHLHVPVFGCRWSLWRGHKLRWEHELLLKIVLGETLSWQLSTLLAAGDRGPRSHRGIWACVLHRTSSRNSFYVILSGLSSWGNIKEAC